MNALTYQRAGARVRYVYTDGPVPNGTIGTIEGWLARRWSAQIRWTDAKETFSVCTPDEYEVVR